MPISVTTTTILTEATVTVFTTFKKKIRRQKNFIVIRKPGIIIFITRLSLRKDRL
jgi:hypothetical protein